MSAADYTWPDSTTAALLAGLRALAASDERAAMAAGMAAAEEESWQPWMCDSPHHPHHGGER